MVRQICFALAALLLASCATALKTPTQDLKINIVGAGEALCDVTQKGRRYRAYAPGSIRIYKDKSPMTVRCVAGGNREQSIVLESKITEVVAANAVNGFIPGLGWDYASGAMFQYPYEVTMDFSAMRPTANPEPEYQRVLDQNPDMMGMEEFRPGRAALISDRGTGVPTLPLRSTTPDDVNLIGGMEEEALPAPAAPAVSDGASPSADDLTRTMNPNVFTPSDDSADPEDWQK